MTTDRTVDISTPWIKAAASSTSGQCVEMRRIGGAVEVRDSKDPNGPTLRFSGTQFAAWLDGADGGEYTHLAD
ncbi:MAG TPA: DUF397 domain-containing protein [Kineosporiaceae bacterium]|nr:DUF397 domain-containing protein [Kineosporiaceae bacterium]